MNLTSILCGILLCISLPACYVPFAPVDHRPELVWDLNPSAPMKEPKTTRVASNNQPPIVLTLFQNKSSYPNGGYYLYDKKGLQQTYAILEPEYPLFESVHEALRKKGWEAVKDYNPGSVPQKLPGKNEPASFYVKGIIHGLEVDTLHPKPDEDLNHTETTLYDVAWIRMTFQLLDPSGRLQKSFAVVTAKKILRNEKQDILEQLSWQIADKLDVCLNENQCVRIPEKIPDETNENPKNNRWYDLEQQLIQK